MAIDRSLQGRRVRLDSTTDAYTTLQRGAEGPVRYYRWSHLWPERMSETRPRGTRHVDWDNGSRLALIDGVDSWVLL